MNGPHSKGDFVGGRYEVVGFVGEGGMQYVYAAVDDVLNRKVAVKTPKNASAQKRFERSAVVAAKVNHPNVAKTLDYFETKDRPYLVEELVLGEDLSKALLSRVKCLDPYLVAKVFHHLSRGLAASHHAEVVHRDLKPTNVMVVDGFDLNEIKITDFGIAKMADEELIEAALGGDESITGSRTAVGALPYMAPEAIETPKAVSFPADVWSIGAMIFELLAGAKPFGTGLIAVKKIIEAESPSLPSALTRNPQFSPLSNAIMDVAKKCLKKDAQARPSADELVQLCGSICYPVAKRKTGIVREIKYKSWGFIDSDGTDVFFHLDSVYGERVSEGDAVLFSTHPGGGARGGRAHPVVGLREI